MKAWVAVAVLAGLASVPAVGQTQRAYLNLQAQSDFYACGTACVTGPLVAQYEQLQNNSFGVLNDVNVWTGTNTFNGNVVFNGYTTYNGSGLGFATLAGNNAFTGTNTFSGSVSQVYGGSSPALTANGYGASFQLQANFTGASVINAIYPGLVQYSGFQFVGLMPANSTAQMNGFSSFIRNQSQVPYGGSPTAGESVLYFGATTLEAQGTSGWGINLALGDDYTPATYTSSTMARKELGIELDFYRYHSDTTILAYSAVPANSSTIGAVGRTGYAYGFVVQPWTGGAGFWDISFVSQGGAATTALSVGALAAAGTGLYSQYIAFSYGNPVSTPPVNLQVDPSGILELTAGGAAAGGFQIGNPSGSTQYSYPLRFQYTTSGDVANTAYMQASPTGAFIFTGTGLALTSGTISTTTGSVAAVNYYTGTGGATPGTSCGPGATTGSFTVVGGIVTHC